MKLRFPRGLRRMRRHLYLQIFLAFLGILLMLAILTGGLFWHYAGGRVVTADEHIATLLGRLLPAPASAAENESVLRAINGISGGTVALYSASGDLLQVIGNAAPRIEQAIRPHAAGQPFHPAILPDGRKLVLEWDPRDTSKHFGWIAIFLLLAAIGAWLGWQILPLTILLSSLVGAVVGVGLIILAKRGRNVPIPFGPYLAAAGLLALFWGKELTETYLSLM